MILCFGFPISTPVIPTASLVQPMAHRRARQEETVEPRLLRFPSVHGNTVIFSYGGDLWVTTLQGGAARRLTSGLGSENRPFISPDGTTVAFSGQYEGPLNIYTIPLDGGEPKRLTYNVEGDLCFGWTPEGKIAYGSSAGNFIGRQFRLWTVDPTGGLPNRTVIDEAADVSYFPDGQTIAYNRQLSFLFNWRHYRGGSQGKISFYNFPQNKYWELPAGREQNYYPMVVGDSVYFTCDRQAGVLNLYRYDLKTKREEQLTKYPVDDVRTPSTDGKTIVFEMDGLLYAYDIASRQTHKVEARIHAEDLSARPYLRPLPDSMSNLTLSPSGARVAVEARGNIFSVPAKHGDTRNFTNLSGARARFPQWSPDGATIAYVSDQTGNYEIYTAPQLGGTPVQLTTGTKGTITSLTYSPTGKSLYFTTTENALFRLDTSTKQITQLAKPPYGVNTFDVSPDDAWVAYTAPVSATISNLYLVEVATGKTIAVDNAQFNDSNVAFDLSGKYLYLTSNRTFNPTYGQYEFSLKVTDSERVYVIPLAKDTPNPLTVESDEEPAAAPSGPPSGPGPGPRGPRPGPPTPDKVVTKVDPDGLASRILPLPMAPGTYLALSGADGGIIYWSDGTLSEYNLKAHESTALFAGLLGEFTLNPARTKLAYHLGPLLGVVDLHPGLQIGQGRVDTSGIEEIIDPRKEWKQMYWEAWRYERDHYYDPSMRGLNWLAIGKKYEAYLPWVSTRTDLSYVIGLLIGELGTSHSYVIGGDMGPAPRAIPVGMLGADYAPADGHLRFARIYRGHNYEESARGPLAEPGVQVHEGDYLLAIDGQPVNDHTNPAALLLDKASRYVTLTVNTKPTMDGATKVRVRPVASEANLRYYDFVDRVATHVDEVSHGRIGYMHIRDTAAPGSIDFIRGFYPQTGKDAVIVDERWNGGGYPQPWFVDTLARKTMAMMAPRNGHTTPLDPAIDGPKVMLINGYAGSGGDLFPWMFRTAGLGPLFGERTWGGLVGISEEPNLVDGGIVTAPSFAIYDPATGEIIAENQGIDPDVQIDRRPDEVANGVDAQVDAAVKYLMDYLEKHPSKVKEVTVPVVGPKGRIGG